MKTTFNFLAIFFTINCFSQITYEPGYFIDNTGKRTECLIRNIAWKDNPVQFEYRISELVAPQTAIIKNVAEFSAGAYKFVRFTGDVELSPDDVNVMSSKKEFEPYTDTIFLKALVEGDVTLYEYTRGNTTRFFYAANGITQQLLYKPYRIGAMVGYNNAFRGQLYEAMKGRISDQSRFKNLKYGKDSLTKLFLEYNGTEGSNTTDFTSGQNKTQFDVKVTAGVNLAAVSIGRQIDNNRMNTMEFDTKPVFSAGLEVELIFPFNNRKWSVFANPNYQSYRNTGTTNFEPMVQQWKLEYNFIEIPVGVRHYMHLGDKSKLFINVGYSASFAVGDSKASYQYKVNNSAEFILDTEAKKSGNIVLGAGFSYDKFAIELRYNAKKEIMANTAYWESEYTSIGAILSYKLF